MRDEYCWDTPDGSKTQMYVCHGQHGNQEFRYRDVSTSMA